MFLTGMAALKKAPPELTEKATEYYVYKRINKLKKINLR